MGLVFLAVTPANSTQEQTNRVRFSELKMGSLLLPAFDGILEIEPNLTPNRFRNTTVAAQSAAQHKVKPRELSPLPGPTHVATKILQCLIFFHAIID